MTIGGLIRRNVLTLYVLVESSLLPTLTLGRLLPLRAKRYSFRPMNIFSDPTRILTILIV